MNSVRSILFDKYKPLQIEDFLTKIDQLEVMLVLLEYDLIFREFGENYTAHDIVFVKDNINCFSIRKLKHMGKIVPANLEFKKKLTNINYDFKVDEIDNLLEIVLKIM